MASSYPSPFEGTGEAKEGFLCPLCLKDLQSFYQLQDHYEEEHSGDDRHVRGQLKSESHELNLQTSFTSLVLFGSGQERHQLRCKDTAVADQGNCCLDELAAHAGAAAQEGKLDKIRKR